MLRRGKKHILLVLTICSAALLSEGVIADPLHAASTNNNDRAKVKTPIEETADANPEKFGQSSLVCFAQQAHKKITKFPVARYAWGEKLDGLRISISQVNRLEQNDYDKPRFNIALQNIGKKDLVLNLGIMLANGKEQYSTAVKLILTDPNGKTYEFHNNIGRHPGIAGRVDPFVVPLAVGCTYILRVDFDNYWFVSPVGVPVPLPQGRYRVAAVFNGKAVTFKQTGVYTQDLYWNGVIKSKKILFENPCTAPAYQKPGSIAFEEPKKLAPPRGHTNWISECINRTEYISPGKTRAELLEVFTTEGGISTRLWRRYVYRQCPYIKVDVEFKAIDDGRYEKPGDIITKISKPYLEWPIAN